MGHKGLSGSVWICVSVVALTPHIILGDVSYSVLEEMKHGSVLGNIAKDLGLDTGTLSARKARIDAAAGSTRHYYDINLKTGELTVDEPIDREELCSEKTSCTVKFDMVLERPLESHRFTLQIQDINDNSPSFPKDVVRLEIRESAHKGARYRVNEARDTDIGQNAVQRYSLQRNDHFIVSVNSHASGRKIVELVLDKELDREQQDEVILILTALDGGSPPRSGTVAIHVTVLDANDNAPVFSQEMYEATLPENAPTGTIILAVLATDADDGPNGEVTYEFSHLSNKARSAFSLDSVTGEIKVIGPIDFEEDSKFEILVEGKDGFGLSSDTKVVINIADVNDNTPVIYLKSLNSPIPENAAPGTEVGIINAQDADSDKNGQILYPTPGGNTFMTEMVPKAIQANSLVSKVIAVDADSGQNAWLSYHIVKSTDAGLFTIGVHNGEIRTQRDVSESDVMKQTLVVSVKDNGQPPLSATCTVNLLISDNLAEVPELKDVASGDSSSKLTAYLIIALVSVSTFFLMFVIIAIAVKVCQRKKPTMLFDGALAIPSAYLPPNYADVDGTGTLRSAYHYDGYMTTGSRTSDFKFATSYNEETLPADMTLKKSLSIDHDSLIDSIDLAQTQSAHHSG
ncbi:protocadherin gamma-B2-like [Engraulis encrasicolus]|uniref:protocadherin gamma-B2-like n=1 Tax=Engraulis encrasicolus TaxID=184585 RepID=UPI002FD21CE1